jgi:hypothetical protein
MRYTPGTPKLGRLLRSCIPLLVAAQLPAGELRLIGKSTVDKEALTFAHGPATRFGPTVNGRTHQQSPLTTCRGYQYVTYIDAGRRVCLGRRKLPAGRWEIVRFTDHRFESNDAHNTAVIGICDADGTIHMAFDHHATRLNYRVSQPGVAHRPDSVRWDPGLFTKVMHTLGSVGADKQVTYPRFFSAPNGNLMLYYRSVTSGNGHGMIEEYNGARHDWTPGLGRFIARDMGTYSVGGARSKFRCPYLNSISYAGQRLHVSWIWRDRFDKTDVRNQHDLCYAYSDDHGRTWHNSDGRMIGETGSSFIHVNTPGVIVAPIPSHSGLSNQNTHYAYPDGSVHIMLLQRRAGHRKSVYHHHWRTSHGAWKFEALGFTGSRPKLVGTEDRGLFLLYEAQDELRIAKGVPKAPGAGWTWSGMDFPRQASLYGEPVLDLHRWEQEQVLSVYCQEAPTRTVRANRSNPVDGSPSPLNVVDYRIIRNTNTEQ